MTATAEFIRRLGKLPKSDLCRLRRLAGKPIHERVDGFDLFTGLWWPLRQRTPRVPRREVSWLVAKLFAAFPLPHSDRPGDHLPVRLGRLEPVDDFGRARFLARFDSLLAASIDCIEPHLRWALSVLMHNAAAVDWVRLTDELSAWDRIRQGTGTDVRSGWPDYYLQDR